MKPTTGNAKPRRSATPRPRPSRQKVRLDLKRRPTPEPEREIVLEKKSTFWKWVLFVGLLHVLVILAACIFYAFTPAPKPPEQFISLLPQGDVVKGTVGEQQAHKLGPTTSAPSVHHHEHASSSTPPPKPQAAVPPLKPLIPPPVLQPPPKPDSFALDKPAVKPPPTKPTPPKPAKVKVDLTLADAPGTTDDKPKKHHIKKPIKPAEDTDAPDLDTADNPDSTGLSKEEIAAKLGEKLDASGVSNATHTGTSGSTNTRENPYSSFYNSIAQQVDEQWQIPNVAAEIATNPVVHIYVEKDGRVPPESVYLSRSSGNSVYDDSAVAAAKSLGYLHEPLPEGCPPDITINVKPAQ